MPSLLILTSGTRGDVEPYVELARALSARGYRVVIAAHLRYRALVGASGIDFRGLGTNPSDLLLELVRDLEASRSPIGKVEGLRRYHKAARSAYCELARSTAALLRGIDLALLSLPTYFLYPVAKALGVEAVACPLQPLTPSSRLPSALLPPPRWGGRAGSRLSHVVAGALIWLPWRRALRAWAARELPGARFSRAGPLGLMIDHGVPFVYGVSPLVLDRPEDWPPEHRLGGFWISERGSPPEGVEGVRLLAFLRAPASEGPVVYVGFGSLEYLYRSALETVPRLLLEMGCRVVLQSGDRGAGSTGKILRLSAPLPHDWLFGRVRAAVHHGGAGTFARACRAGIPSLALVAQADSAFWAARGAALRVSPSPVRRNSSEHELRRALERLVYSPSLRANAARLGAKLSTEDGPALGAEMIDRIAARRRGGGAPRRRSPPRRGSTAS